MGAIFGFLHEQAAGVAPAVWSEALEAAAPFAHDGLYQWRAGPIALGRAINRVRERAGVERHGLPEDFDAIQAAGSIRLDNRAMLLPRLRLPASVSDTAVLIAAYAEWELDCLCRLEGDFAFALWDARRQRLLCARDRVGMRPLLFSERGPGFAFASTLPLLGRLDGGAMDPAPSRLLAQLDRNSSPAEGFWTSTQRLPPGSLLTVGIDQPLRTDRYWELRAQAVACRGASQWADAAREVLDTAVGERMAELPAGLMLSGGLDSSFLLGLMVKRAAPSAIRAVSSVAREDAPAAIRDERGPLAELVQAFPGLGPELVADLVDDPFDPSCWQPLWALLGRPGNGFLTMDQSLLAAAARRGARCVLSGFWGDGGLSYHGAGWSTGRISDLPWRQSPELLRRMAQRFGIPVGRALAGELARGLGSRLLPSSRATARAPGADTADRGAPVRRRLFATMPCHALPDIVARGFHSVEEQTVVAASVGVELAMPFLAPKVLEFTVSVPPEIFVAGGWPRGLAREAMRGLVPESIRLRTDKTAYLPTFMDAICRQWPAYLDEAGGADDPLRDWFRHSLGERAHHPQLHAVQAVQLWRYLQWVKAATSAGPAVSEECR